MKIRVNCISFVPTRFPFDTNNSPIGYLIAIISEYVIFGYEYCVIACSLAVGMGAFWFGISVTKEIQHTLNSINHKAHANKMRSKQLKILFLEFMHAHAAIKRYTGIHFNLSNEQKKMHKINNDAVFIRLQLTFLECFTIFLTSFKRLSCPYSSGAF